MQKTLAAAAILAAAGTTFAQVTPGPFSPDATDDMESYPGVRTFLTSLFSGNVGVGGALSFASVDAGDWLDFRAPGGPIAPTSGTKFGTIFGFGSVDFDFSSIGGITGFGFQASAAGVGTDDIEFFDLGGAPIGFFSDPDGYGPGDGTMEPKAWTSTVAIGSVRVTGPETAFDDFRIVRGDVPAQILIYTESNGDDNEIAAADNLGLNYDLIRRDTPALNAALASGDYVFAIIHQPANNFAAGFDAELDAFVSGGNRVHFSFWNLDAEPALQSTLGVDSTVDFFAPRPVFDNAGHPSWGGAASPVAVDGDDWNDNGDAVTGDEVVSTFDSASGDGATVVSNDNRTLTNAFEYDSMESSGMTDLLEAQIDWVEDALPPAPPGCQPELDFEGIGEGMPISDEFPGVTFGDGTGQTASISSFSGFFGSDVLCNATDGGGNRYLTLVMEFDGGLTELEFDFNSAGTPSTGFEFPIRFYDAGGLVSTDGILEAGSAWTRDINYSLDGTIIRVEIDSFNDGWLFGVDNMTYCFGDDDCYADFDDDGSLTIFDFLAFQNAFDGGDLAADCDGDGVLTLFDFLCFQNAFDAGCD
ncbi:MAG: GC-type dockerin domain-anchored protein [Phycisphaerales bacterium]